jgi:hypothetical protein
MNEEEEFENEEEQANGNVLMKKGKKISLCLVNMMTGRKSRISLKLKEMPKRISRIITKSLIWSMSFTRI